MAAFIIGGSRGPRWFLAAAFCAGAVGQARADEYDDTSRKLVELEQRIGAVSTEFKDNSRPETHIAERRLVDAQTLFELKSYAEASTLLLDIVDKYPNTKVWDDAIVLLGESFYQSRDLLSARRHFQMAVKGNTGSHNEQKALNRLIEISLKTGDYDQIDEYLARLAKIPPDRQDPSVPYVRGKYMFFRDRMDEAVAAFTGVAPSNPYYLQARYFLGTIQVKREDLAAAATSFDAILRMQPRTDNDREIQDLSRMAIGRLYYDRAQFDRAREMYESIPRNSKHWSDARFEAAWNAIKGKDFKAAFRSLDLLLLQDPDSPKAPELRLLMGNLNIRLENFFLASETFTKSRDEFEPIHKQLIDTIEKSRADASYFDQAIGKNLGKFDITLIVPPQAVRWVKNEPQVARMLTLVSDVSDLQSGIQDAEKLLVKLEQAVNGQGKVGIFPDLVHVRISSSEVLNQTLDMRKRLVKRARGLANPTLNPEDKVALERVDSDRGVLEASMKDLPLTAEAIRARDTGAKREITELDKHAAEINVLIHSLEAELTAVQHYYKTSGPQQKIKPEDMKRPVADLQAEIERLRSQHDGLRNQITELSRAATVAGAAGESERTSAMKLGDLLKEEYDVYSRARGRMSGNSAAEFDRISGLLGRADAVQRRVADLDERVDRNAETRLVGIREKLVREKNELVAASSKLGKVLNESQTVGGGLAQAVLHRVTDRFYDLVVQSDVGVIDVAWGLKDQKTQGVSKLINQQKLEMKTLDDDFRALLEEESK